MNPAGGPVREAERYGSILFDASANLLVTTSARGEITDANREIACATGIPREELIGRKFADLFVEPEKAADLIAQGLESAVCHFQLRLKGTADLPRDVCFHAVAYHNQPGQIAGVFAAGHDISDMKVRAQEAQQNLELIRTLLDFANDTMEIVDMETLHVVDVNERACRDLGYTREELLQLSVPEIDADYGSEQVRKVKSELDESGSIIFETRHRRKDGRIIPVEVSIGVCSADRRYVFVVARNITERRKTELALHESEERFRRLIEDASDPISIFEKDGAIRYTSPATFELSGYQPEELVGRNFLEFVHPLDLEKAGGQVAASLGNPQAAIRGTSRLRRKDGVWVTIEATVRNCMEVSPINGLVCTLRDVTARDRSSRALQAMSAVNAALVRGATEQELADDICGAMVEIGGYRTAWIGYREDDEEKSIRVVAKAGEVDEYLERARITWAGHDRGLGPSGTAMRTGVTQVARDYPGGLPNPYWGDAARRRGYLASIAIPLGSRRQPWGVLTLYAGDPTGFDDAEVELLKQLAADLSYGVESMRGRQQHLLDMQRVEETLEATIYALSATMEKRDPYTSGHQIRVARLCVAIAKRMGIDPNTTRGLELAALIHDVGKIEIPSEVLAKPGKLSDAEFALIKIHPEAGYDIVKNIDFPWPVAKIVLQHHERMDGSGYPSGLTGDETLLESKILQVADVVEAISSHRPYRPARGMDVALDEIRRGSGTKFDPRVVEACLVVCRASDFQI